MRSRGIESRWMGVGTLNPWSVKERKREGCRPEEEISIQQKVGGKEMALTHALKASSAHFTFRDLSLSLRLLNHLSALLHVTLSRCLANNLLQILIVILTRLFFGCRDSPFLLASQGSKYIRFLVTIGADFGKGVGFLVCQIWSRAFWHPGGIFLRVGQVNFDRHSPGCCCHSLLSRSLLAVPGGNQPNLAGKSRSSITLHIRAYKVLRHRKTASFYPRL